MRVHHRVAFSPPLAQPLAGARRVERNLCWHGFTRVRRDRGEVGFARRAGVFRSEGARKVRMIAGGEVRLDPGGTHASLDLEYSGSRLVLRALGALPLVLLPLPWWARALALAELAWTVVRWRRSVGVMEGFVRAAAEGPP